MNKIQTCFLFILIAGLSTLTSAEQGKPESAVVGVQSNFESGTTLRPPTKKIAVIGGMDENSKEVKCYDSTNQSWDIACLPKMPEKRLHHGAVQIDTKLYVVGGMAYENKKYNISKSMDILDLETRTRQWSKRSDMGTKRGYHGTAVLNGLIYVVGGYEKHIVGRKFEVTLTGEVYNPNNNSWNSIAPIPSNRSHFSLVPVNNKLYAIGGENIGLNIVECYDPVKNSWSTKTSSFPVKSQKVSGAAVLDGKIYVAGLVNLEMYDPLTEKWETIARFLDYRGSQAIMVAFENKLYIFGGGFAASRGLTGEIYDPASNSSVPFPAKFKKDISFAASLILTGTF